jgi:DNA-binding transcriptional LysR family regulator
MTDYHGMEEPMDVTKCNAFLVAVDTGSMTAAAERLGYTQSGVTRMIRSLEEEIGFSLLVRTKKGVVMTENGKNMLAVFRDIVRVHENAEQRSAEIRGVISGTLTVGSFYSISALWMPFILKRFEEQHPYVNIRMQENGTREISQWLNDKSVDCCFCSEPSEGTICDWIPLWKDEMVAWLPKSHPFARAASIPVGQLAKERIIRTLPNHDTDQDRLLLAAHLHPDGCFSTQDGFTTYTMVAAGLGVSVNQRLITKRWNGDVAEVPFEPPCYITMGIAVPSQREVSPATKKFIACAKEVIHELNT